VPTPGLTPRHSAGLLCARADTLTPTKRRASERLRALHPDIAAAAMLLDRFT
jgi:hypothetical protein